MQRDSRGPSSCFVTFRDARVAGVALVATRSSGKDTRARSRLRIISRDKLSCFDRRPLLLPSCWAFGALLLLEQRLPVPKQFFAQYHRPLMVGSSWSRR
jgi:hypothetical protein